MFRLDAILREPEPISVLRPMTVTIDGRQVVQPTEVPLGGIYEVHDMYGTAEMTSSGERVDQSALLIGSVDPLLVAGQQIRVGGEGVHRGRQYQLGVVKNLRSHVEIALEDVRHG